MTSVKEQLEAAESKDQLYDIARSDDRLKAVKVSKRKGIETIRAELAEALDKASPGETPPEQPPAEGDNQSPDADPNRHGNVPEQTRNGTGEEPNRDGQNAQAQQSPTKHVAKGKGRKGETRKLRNTKTGVVFVYTAQLARRNDMKEV